MRDKDAYIAELESRVHTLEEIIKVLPGHVYWKDRNSVHIGCNQQQAEYIGLKSPKEISGLTARDLVSKCLSFEDQEKEIVAVEAADKKVIDSNQTIVLEEIQHLPGGNRYYLSTKAPLHDVAGNVTGVIGVSIDITQQKQAEVRERAALAEAAAAQEQAKAAAKLHLLASIIDVLPVNVYWKDRKLAYLGCNEQHAKHMGFKSSKDMVGLLHKDIVSKGLSLEEKEKEINEIETSDNRVMASNQAFVFEEIQYLPEGNVYYISTKAPLHDLEGNVIGVAGVSIDITKQKNAEIRAQAETELRQSVMVLAGSIAHDLRTPLLIVRALSEVMDLAVPKLMTGYELAQAADAKSVERIPPLHWRKLPDIPKELGKVVTEMNEYINVSLKSLSQVLTKDIKPEDLEVCDAESCIKNALSRYPFLEGEQALVHTDFSYTFNFKGNQVLVFRILSNLIKNALEQIQKKQRGEIFISMQKTDNMNHIIIKDTAGGASPELVANLFGGYKTTKEGGTGVGLAFCKLTMDTFQGTISAQSVEGEYIEFILGFPVV